MEHRLKTIEDAKAEMVAPLEEQVAPLLAKIRENKRFVNQLCAFAKVPPAYTDAEVSDEGGGTGAPSIRIREDQFFNEPLAKSAREYLEMRKAANLGLASIDEIYDALKSGGYAFVGGTEDIKKNGLAISLGKNATVFVKVSGKWGLTSWYGIKRYKRADGASANGGASENNSGEEQSNPTTIPTVEVVDKNTD